MNNGFEKMGFQVAVISDIHGNRWALETVLEDIKKRQINRLVNLGDSLYGPLDPGGTANILMEYKIPTVSGNEDRLIWEAYSDQDKSPTLDYVRKNLTSAHLDWIKSLELTRTAYQFFFLCHGTPFFQNKRGGEVRLFPGRFGIDANNIQKIQQSFL